MADVQLDRLGQNELSDEHAKNQPIPRLLLSALMSPLFSSKMLQIFR